MEVKKIRRAAAGICTAAMMALNSVQSFAAAPLVMRALEVDYNHRAEVQYQPRIRIYSPI